MRISESTLNILKSSKKKRKEYFKYDPKFEISQMLIDARIQKGITQKELAKKMGVHQPAISRLENGKSFPSLSLLNKVAKAYKTQLLPPKFRFMTSYDIEARLEEKEAIERYLEKGTALEKKSESASEAIRVAKSNLATVWSSATQGAGSTQDRWSNLPEHTDREALVGMQAFTSANTTGSLVNQV